MYAELRGLLDSDDFANDGKILVVGQRFNRNDVTIELAVWSDSEAEPSSWMVRCEEHRRFRIQQRAVHDLAIVDDHVVIAACDEKRSDLYFAGRPANPHEAFGLLIRAHRTAVEEWLPMSELIVNGPEIFTTAGGLIARAPHRIVQRYLQALREGGVDAYLTNASDPARWNGTQWIPESELLSALVFGGNYVVAGRFSFSRTA